MDRSNQLAILTFKCRCFTQSRCLLRVPSGQFPSSPHDQWALGPRGPRDCGARRRIRPVSTTSCGQFSHLCKQTQSTSRNLGPACSQPLRAVSSTMDSCGRSPRVVQMCRLPLETSSLLIRPLLPFPNSSFPGPKLNKLLAHPSSDQAHPYTTCNHERSTFHRSVSYRCGRVRPDNLHRSDDLPRCHQQQKPGDHTCKTRSANNASIVDNDGDIDQEDLALSRIVFVGREGLHGNVQPGNRSSRGPRYRIAGHHGDRPRQSRLVQDERERKEAHIRIPPPQT